MAEDNEDKVHVSESELAAAFTEWDRRFREEPERYESEAVRLLKSDAETYGDKCAPYLISILEEQRRERETPMLAEEDEGGPQLPPPPGQTAGPG